MLKQYAHGKEEGRETGSEAETRQDGIRYVLVMLVNGK
jgi:hypothetical protein